MKEKSPFWQGARAAAPLLPGVVPFAMVTGAMVAEQGMSLWGALGFSVIIFAGASQLTVLTLAQVGAPLLVMALTALAINLRMMLYSAVLAPMFSQSGRATRGWVSYLLTDQAFILTGQYDSDHQPSTQQRTHYFMGVAISLWTTWQLGTVAGFMLGRGVPPSWALDFTVPLSFLAMLVPALRTRPALGAALAAGIAFYWTRHLPFQLGFIAASALGIATGVFLERRAS